MEHDHIVRDSGEVRWLNLHQDEFGTEPMRAPFISLAVCLVLTFVTPARAQQPAPLSALPTGFQLPGAFTCQGAFGNGRVHRSTFTGAVVLADKWLQLTEQDVEPKGYLATYLIGDDAGQTQLVEFDANNFGAATYSSANGWKGGVLTMTSPVSADPKSPYAANRFVYSITGSDTFTVDWQISKTATLAWIGADHLACKRNSAGA
jgi:hypothetical protein